MKETTYTISLGIDTEQYGRLVAFEVVFTDLIAAHTYATIMIGTSAKPLLSYSAANMVEDVEDILLSEKDCFVSAVSLLVEETTEYDEGKTTKTVATWDIF